MLIQIELPTFILISTQLKLLQGIVPYHRLKITPAGASPACFTAVYF